VSVRPLETFASARVSRDSHDARANAAGKHLLRWRGQTSDLSKRSPS
jgi:hypothetical protein